MYTVSELVKNHPSRAIGDQAALIKTIETTLVAAHACVSCADACIGEPDPRLLARCIRMTLDCADVCQATWRMLTRQQEPDIAMVARQLDLCAYACRRAAEECEKHAKTHAHCATCGEACRWCEKACDTLLAGLPVRDEAGPAVH
jgi:hypothetical protein